MLRQSDVVVLQNGYQGFISLLGNEEVVSLIYDGDGNRTNKYIYRKYYKKNLIYPFDYEWSIDYIYRPVDGDSLASWMSGVATVDDENEFTPVWNRHWKPVLAPLPAVGPEDAGSVLMVNEEGQWDKGSIEKDSNFYTIPIVKDGNNCTTTVTADELYAAQAEGQTFRADIDEVDASSDATQYLVANYTWYVDKEGSPKELIVRFCTLGVRTLHQYEVRAWNDDLFINYDEVVIPR